MGKSTVTSLVIAGMVSCVTSCATPDRTGYLIAADHHAKSAQIARDGVAADEAAALSFAAQGDRSAAGHAEESASQSRESVSIRTVPGGKGSMVEPMVAVIIAPVAMLVWHWDIDGDRSVTPYIHNQYGRFHHTVG
jgi:hypothetical protein